MNCYRPDGLLIEKYEHEGGETVVQGLCLVIQGNTASLIVSDFTHKSLLWISISKDFTMKPHHTQQLDYHPYSCYNDRGSLLVCDAAQHEIHRYGEDGVRLDTISLPNDINPQWVIRHSYGDHYVVTDWENNMILLKDEDAMKKTRVRLNTISLHNDTNPQWVIRHSYGDHYVVTDWENNMIVITDEDGNV